MTDAARQELERVLRSQTFQNATRLRHFLRFLVEKKINGESHLLKETVLGVEVFRRGPHFDPKADPIVRVDARRLRAKLGQYYAGEGAADLVRIVLKAGGYIPLLEVAPGKEGSADKHSVAVTPFTCLSSVAGDAHFCEGLTEEVLNALARTRQVLVVALKPQSCCDAAQFVRGSIRRDGRRLRIAVRLMARDGSVLWSEQYDADETEIFSTQETISRRIAQVVGLSERLNVPPAFQCAAESNTLGLAS